jgi:hypothetical protein
MKKINRQFILILLISLKSILHAQTDFRPGFYISLENDTIFGEIDYQGEKQSAKTCFFRQNENSQILQFEPKDIKAFRFNDGKYYISKIFKTHEEDEKHLFLEYLVNGQLKLYYYYDNYGEHYLIENTKGETFALKYEEKEILDEERGRVIKKLHHYRGMLKANMADCQELFKLIDITDLSHKSLINLVKKYHDCVCGDDLCIIYQKKSQAYKIVFAPMIGVNSYRIDFTVEGIYNNLVSEYNMYPVIGLLVDFHHPRIGDKLALTFGLDFSKSHNFSSSNEESTIMDASTYRELNLNTMMIEPSIGLKYTINTKRVKPFFSGGIISNIPFAQDTELYTRKTQFGEVTNEITEKVSIVSRPFWGLNLSVGSDFVLGKKLVIFTRLKYNYSVVFHLTSSQNINLIGLSCGIYL